MNYTNLFKMCGLDEEWQAQNADRIEQFLKQIDITTDEQIKECEEWTKSQFDVTLAGTRGILAVMMKETLDYALWKYDGREICINYTRPTMSVLSQCFHIWENRKNAELGYNKYYARGSSIVFVMVILGTVFNRANHYIEVAEDLGQTAGKGHCSEYQIWEGALAEGAIPPPTVEMSCGLFCDQAPEVEAKMAIDYNYDLIFNDLTLDHEWDSFPNVDLAAIKYLSANTEECYRYLEENYGFDLTEEEKSLGVAQANQLVSAHLGIADLIAKEDGLPVSRADLFLSFISAIIGTVYFDELQAAKKQLLKDIRKRRREGVYVVPPGAPRSWMTFASVSDMRFYHQVEEAGIHCTHIWFEPVHPEVLGAPPQSDIPREQGYELTFRFHSMGDLCGSTIKATRWAVEHFNLDGLMICETMFCRPICVPAVMMKDYVKKEHPDMPVIILELDAYDSRNYTPEQYRTRLESFAEVMRMRKELNEM